MKILASPVKSALPLAFALLAACQSPPPPAELSDSGLRSDVLYFAKNEGGQKAADETLSLFKGRQPVEVVDRKLPKMTAPRPLRQVLPKYPSALRKTKEMGTVTVDFIVAENGGVIDAVATRTSNPKLNDAAVAAVRKWTFAPSTREGIPVRARMAVDVTIDPPNS